jgi:hypothetical protein
MGLSRNSGHRCCIGRASNLAKDFLTLIEERKETVNQNTEYRLVTPNVNHETARGCLA